AVRALEAMRFEVEAVTPELGTIRTREKEVAIPVVCDCGTWNFEPVQGPGSSIVIVNIAERPAATQVAIDYQCSMAFTGHNLYGAPTHQETYRCASRGRIETEFWSTLT